MRGNDPRLADVEPRQRGGAVRRVFVTEPVIAEPAKPFARQFARDCVRRGGGRKRVMESTVGDPELP